MKLKKSLAFALILAMMVPFLASCKKEIVPVDFWNEAANAFSGADTLSYTVKAVIGNNKATLELEENKISGSSTRKINVNEQKFMIYKDKENTYYSFPDYDFFVKNSENNAKLEKVIAFSLSNEGKFNLNAEDLNNLVFNKDETGASFSFLLTGEKLKELLGVNDNLTFSACSVSARINSENKFTFIDISTKYKGSEIFGIPLPKEVTDFQEIKISIENIDLSDTNKANPPENASDYAYLPIMSQILPTALITAAKNSSSTSYVIDLDVDMAGTTMNTHTAANTVTQVIDGVTSSRTQSTTTGNIFGIESNSKEDAYKNGKDDYTYYTDPEGGNYKIIEPEDDEEDEEFFTDITKLASVFQNATITPSTITVKLPKEDVLKLLSSLEEEDLTTPDGATPGVQVDQYEFEETEIVIRLENGFFKSFETEFSFSTKGDIMGTGQAQTLSVSIKILFILNSPLQDYVVEAPAGYENYPNWS